MFKVILADPPWTFRVRSPKGTGRSASNHYSLMTIEDIIGLGPKVQAVADKDAVLFLWACNSQLPEALATMEAWGFDYVSLLTWVKMTKDNSRPAIGLGYRFRGVTEQLMFGVRKGGRTYSPPPAQRKPGIIMSPRREHSKKPDEQWPYIECYPGPYLEMFSRERREGWTCLGNEIGEKLDIRESLPKILLPKRRKCLIEPSKNNTDVV